MTAHTKLSAKGQIVIPKDVRDRLGWPQGSELEVIERGGEVVLRMPMRTGAQSGKEAVANAVREIQSFYRYEGQPVSIEDMDRAVKQAVRDKFVRKLAK